MACNRWKKENKYLSISQKAIDWDFNYCPFCGSELDEEGCTKNKSKKI